MFRGLGVVTSQLKSNMYFPMWVMPWSGLQMWRIIRLFNCRLPGDEEIISAWKELFKGDEVQVRPMVRRPSVPSILSIEYSINSLFCWSKTLEIRAAILWLCPLQQAFGIYFISSFSHSVSAFRKLDSEKSHFQRKSSLEVYHWNYMIECYQISFFTDLYVVQGS